MNTKTLNNGNATVNAYIPDEADINAVEAGKLALNCWGRFAEVTEVVARKRDINGKLFVCYATKDGSGTMSMSMKQDELVRTVHLTGFLSSQQCNKLEFEMRNAKSNPPVSGRVTDAADQRIAEETAQAERETYRLANP